ncbi:hypothetical protein P4O66_021274 [Electrophorus voltai]|uniref:CCHC-type domain-containing protein n=1 Tax=Electrophorus voltai TaxID=2609070 RepID=A0AAD8ZNR8_9TELE|nr:hypothetical protein P4O66_021274 [Electrophorus voltai]
MADGGSPDGGPRSPGLAGGASAKAPEPGGTTPTEPGSGAGGGGLLNTARFRWEDPGDGTVFTERVLFIREVLFGALGLTPGDLICAQRNGPLGFYDVTLSTAENYRRVLDRRVELQRHPVGGNITWWIPCGMGIGGGVTTHVFNPHVPTDLIRRFLQGYGTVHPGERMVRGELGIWNGRRQYQMSFKEDGKGGLVYPPALFAIDGNRGYLFYRDQPVFCRSCRGHGHKMEDCPELECLNCLEKGHLARDCRGPRRCRQCRREGHLARSCFPGGRTYAAAVVRGTRDRVVDTASTGEQAEPEVIEAQILDLVKEERVEEPLSRDQALQAQDGQLEAGQSQETVKAPAVVRKRMRASGRIPGEDSRSTKAKRAGKGEAAPKSPPTFAPGPDSTGSFPSPSPPVMDFDFAQLVRTAEQRPLEHRPGTAGDLEDLRRISGPEPATGEQMADGGSPDGGPRSPGLAGGASAEALELGRTTPTEPGSGAGGGGLLNTARFRWENPGDGTVFTERVLFIREVLFDALGLTPGDLICVQRNGPLGFYDVTLSTVENYRRVLDRRVELQHHPVGKYYVVDPLWDGNRRVVTTHVFNPHVPTDLIRRFLQEYGTVHPGERMVRDELGIWNGRRQYQGSAGFLPELPGGPGHRMEDCPELECLNCLEKGHLARDCRGPRRCRQCRREGHLARSCPGGRTYAAAVVRGIRDRVVDTASTGEQAEPEVIEAQILDLVKEERVEEPLSRDQALQAQDGQLEAGQSQETVKAPAVVRKRMRASGGDPRGGLKIDEGEEGWTREAAGVGDQALPRLQDRPEMATAEVGMAPRSTAQAAEAPAKTPTAGRAPLAEPGLRAGSGLLNTARFRWRDPQDGTCFTERVLFIREVLFGGFGLDPGALICAQRNGAQKYFDVTFASDAIYRRVLELGDGMGGHPLGKDFILEPLWDGDRRMVTIHFFNPHVSAAEVRRFLTMYGEVLPSERMVRDELGIWNGRRQFFMKFVRNSEGQERGCQRYGHLAEGCQDYVCRNCLGPGHQAKDCKNPRRCRDCRGEGHMAHSCPGRVQTYAAVLAEGGSAALQPSNPGGEGLVTREEAPPPGDDEENITPPAIPGTAPIPSSSPSSSSAGEEDPTPGQTPRSKGAPPAPLGKAKRKRKQALLEQDKRMKAGSPLTAAPDEESLRPTDPSLLAKPGGLDENTLSPPLHYGGREGSPNETPYIGDIGDRVEGGDSSVLDS